MDYSNVEDVLGDVIIVGAGGAGMRAAIAASEQNLKVILATKGQVARSGATPMACPSYQAAFATEDDMDSTDIAFEDTCYEGRYLGDENLIQVLTEEAMERALDLSRYGVKFRKKSNGKYLQVVHPGQSFERNLVIVGSGYAMAAGLRREVRRRKNIQVFEDHVATRLFCNSEGKIAGLLALDMRRGILSLFRGKAVIIATGGYPELWRWTDTEPGLTGEGVFLAYQVGADLVDLEMMLYYPTGLCYPSEVEGTLVQYEGLLTSKYCAGVMLNGCGEPFFSSSDKLPVRDVMMKLIYKEMSEGRSTPNGGVYIDLSMSPKSPQEIRKKLNELDSLPYDQLRALGIDVLKERIEVKPVTHYTLGGVRINEWSETTVEGLFAAGEVAGNIHGANRTSGNALAETQVFGSRAGERAAAYAIENDIPKIDPADVQKEVERVERLGVVREGVIRPIELKRKTKEIMHNLVGYKRDAKGLHQAIEALQELREDVVPKLRITAASKIYNYEWEEALEATTMVSLSELVAASALTREESRGHHWRADFPKMRQEWERHTIVRFTGVGSYSISDAPVIRINNRRKDRRSPDPVLIDITVSDGHQEV